MRINMVLFVISICLNFASPAAAHLHPTMARFMQRDPLGFRDGASLIEGLKSLPTMNLDPYGTDIMPPPSPYDDCPCTRSPAMTDGACCNLARSMGLDAGDSGGVICCYGDMVACGWNIGNGTPQDNFVMDILNVCTTLHEKDHFDDQATCNCRDGIKRSVWRTGPNPPNRAAEECGANKIEYRCLLAHALDCAQAPDPLDCQVGVLLPRHRDPSAYATRLGTARRVYGICTTRWLVDKLTQEVQ
jgi:hypothetical protein